MNHRRIFVLAVMTAFAVIAAAEAATPKKNATTKPAAGKAIKYKVKQPAEFVALARKASKLKGVYVKGSLRVRLLGGAEKPPKKLVELKFEMWATRTLTRSRQYRGRSRGCSVSDGKHVYKFDPAGGGGQRRKLTADRFYQGLGVAAVYCDGAQGYANLGNAVSFKPIGALDEYAKEVPGLKWFQVTAGKESRHPFLRKFDTVKYGFSLTDGLVRVMHFEQADRDPSDRQRGIRYETVILAEHVTPKALKADDFKLPAEAATAKWTDLDTGKAIDPPKALIAAKAAAKTEK